MQIPQTLEEYILLDDVLANFSQALNLYSCAEPIGFTAKGDYMEIIKKNANVINCKRYV